MSAPRELRLDVGWGALAALTGGTERGARLLFLHGWMDNAASFLPLSEHLADTHWVALDNAGHGASDHRPAPARYYFTDYVFDLDAALDALGWDRCTLVGHSLGSAVAACYACADPQRVERMVMLDGLGVVTEAARRAGPRLTRSLQSVRRPRDHRSRFESVEQAGRARRIKTPMEAASSELLAERALRRDGDQWRWRTDPGAMWDSPYWMVEEQALSILDGIKCPVLAVITPSLERYLGEHLDERLAALADVTDLRVNGGHHVHMDRPELFAADLRGFLHQEDLQNG